MIIKPLIRSLICTTCVAALVAACQAPDSPEAPPILTAALTPTDVPDADVSATEVNSPAPSLATPYAAVPAAGICAGPTDGKIASVEIWPDMPAPRCLRITPGQQLQVTNRTEMPVRLVLGVFEASLQPGETYTLDSPFGEYLATGVHRLETPPFGGPELWLEN